VNWIVIVSGAATFTFSVGLVNVIPDGRDPAVTAVIVIVGTGFPFATTLNVLAIPATNVAVFGLVMVGAD
jgi:hypothetical protein